MIPCDNHIHHRGSIRLKGYDYSPPGLTQGERDAVYEAVINLVEARLRKAQSLRPGR